MSPKPDDVIAGEPIEASWGNQSIRDHTVLQMTNEADRDQSFPAGQFGDVCYVADIQELQVVSVSDYGTEGWLEIALVEDVERAIIQALDDYLPLTGGTLTGPLDVKGGTLTVGDETLSTSFAATVQRLVSAVKRSLRTVISASADTEGHGLLVHSSNDVDDTRVFIGDGKVQIVGTTTTAWLGLERQGVSHRWQFAIANDGDLLLRSSSDAGATWDEVDTWAGI